MSLFPNILVPAASASKRFSQGILLALLGCFVFGAAQAQDKPNILVIWGDDVGWFNTSAYNLSLIHI